MRSRRANGRERVAAVAAIALLLAAGAGVFFLSHGPTRPPVALARGEPAGTAGSDSLRTSTGEPASESGASSNPVSTRSDTEGSLREPEREAVEVAPESYTLKGTLSTSDGEGEVGDASLELRTGLARWEPIRVAADGSWEREALAPGTQRLRARLAGYQRLPHSLVLEGVPTTRTVALVLQVEPRVLVRVATPDGGSPRRWLTGVRLDVTATREPLPAWLSTAVQARDRLFATRVDWERASLSSQDTPDVGTLVLRRDDDAHINLVVGRAVIASRAAPRGTREVSFVVDRAQIEALSAELVARFVRAENGLPLSGELRLARRTLTLDDEGSVRADVTRPGPLDLRLSSPGRAHWQRRVVLQPGAVHDLGTVAVEPEVKVTVLVHGLESSKLVSLSSVARVMLVPYEPGHRGRVWKGKPELEHTFGLDDPAVFERRPPGRYLVRASSGARASDTVLVDTRAGASLQLALDLADPVQATLPERVALGRTLAERASPARYPGPREYRVLGPGGYTFAEGSVRNEGTRIQLHPGENQVVLYDSAWREVGRAHVVARESAVVLDADDFE